MEAERVVSQDVVEQNSKTEKSQEENLKEIKTKEANTKCHICLKVFSDKSKLSTHVEVVHMKIKKVCCQKCDAKFQTKRTLNTHILVSMLFRSLPCRANELVFVPMFFREC
jgi:hypothetical protein